MAKTTTKTAAKSTNSEIKLIVPNNSPLARVMAAISLKLADEGTNPLFQMLLEMTEGNMEIEVDNIGAIQKAAGNDDEVVAKKPANKSAKKVVADDDDTDDEATDDDDADDSDDTDDEATDDDDSDDADDSDDSEDAEVDPEEMSAAECKAFIKSATFPSDEKDFLSTWIPEDLRAAYKSGDKAKALKGLRTTVARIIATEKKWIDNDYAVEKCKALVEKAGGIASLGKGRKNPPLMIHLYAGRAVMAGYGKGK